jgi:hypothetical protein
MMGNSIMQTSYVLVSFYINPGSNDVICLNKFEFSAYTSVMLNLNFNKPNVSIDCSVFALRLFLTTARLTKLNI